MTLGDTTRSPRQRATDAQLRYLAKPGIREKVNRKERERTAMYASAVAMYKLERGCADCGYDEDPAALDLDHINGTKMGAVSRMMNQAIDRILDEIEKCEVVCANCHRMRTVSRLRTRDLLSA